MERAMPVSVICCWTAVKLVLTLRNLTMGVVTHVKLQNAGINVVSKMAKQCVIADTVNQ
jgi:hypothetical protein